MGASLSINSSPKSIYWINAVKALCIIFVFLRHSESYYDWYLGTTVDSLFSTFYVNGFFFISGYLLFWKQLSSPKIEEGPSHYISRTGSGYKLFSNIIFRIMIPSVVFATIEFFPSCLIQGRELSLGYALYKTIGGGTYWFTSALAVSELILLCLLCTRNRNIWFYILLSVLLGAIGMLIVKLGILDNGIWAWRQGLIALILIAMGGVYWYYESKINSLMKWWVIILLLIFYLYLVIGLKDYSHPGINTLSIQPLGIITSTISCLLLVWLCKSIKGYRVLSFIGQNSLGFYFLSGAFPIIFSKVAHVLIPGTYGLFVPIIWIVCLIMAYFVVLFINRWLPWLWDIRRLNNANNRIV